MPNGAQNLGMQLGQLIFGRPDDGRSYVQGQAAGALVGDRMASARRARAAAMIDEDRLGAREGVTPDALTAAGYAPNQSPLLDAILRSNTNVDLRNLGALQAPTAGQALTDAAAAVNLGDMARANSSLALASGKPIETTKVDGSGQVINPYGDPSQQVNLTAIGDAVVREKGANAADKSASAGAHAAAARLRDVQANAGGYNPSTGRGTTVRPGKFVLPPKNILDASIGDTEVEDPFTHRIYRVASPAAIAKFASYLEQQDITDGKAGLVQYLTQKPLGSGMNDRPADVGAMDLGAMMNRPAPAPMSPGRTVVRTGTQNGRKVVQYSDGTIDYAD